jgi:VWFA-related protein
VILFDLMNESFSTRGVAANYIVHDLETLETADNLYLYFLTLEGRLIAVHGIPSAEGEVRQPGGTPWTRQIKPIMDDAMRAASRVRPADIDVAVRVQLTYAMLDALAVQLSRVPGRKNVVWITDGVPIALGPGRSDTGDFVDFTLPMRKLSEGLDRSGVAIYPVWQVLLGSPDNIGGSTGDGNAGGGGTGIQSLTTLDDFAGMTGGRPNAGKDIGVAVKQAMSDLRFSYQIGYYAPPQSRDGKFHKLRVVCKRKGVRIQAKTGYYAWSEPPGTAAKDAIDAAAATTFDASEIGLRGMLSRDPKDRRAAHFEARIDAKDIALGHEGDQYTGQLRLAVVSYEADGRAEGSAVIPLDLHYSAQERDKALKEGVDFSHDVAIGEQVNKVRLIVFDRNSNAIGSLTIPVSAGAQNQPR